MKLILDLEDNIVHNMQKCCEMQGIQMSELITTMFVTTVQNPTVIIDEVIEENNNADKFNDFVALLTHYLNEATHDIESSARSDEAYETDEDMVRVFKALNADIIRQASNITRLYQVYVERN